LDFGDEEHKLTIPEQLTLLAGRKDDITESVQRESVTEPIAILTSKTEIRAHLHLEYLKKMLRKYRSDEIVLKNKKHYQ